MGSLSDMIDFGKLGMAKKVVTHEKLINGLEAPRNSLELPSETFSISFEGDIVPYLYHMRSNWSEKQNLSEVPIMKLIGEKTSKRLMTEHAAPSVVARLMGVDMLPPNVKPVVQKVEKKHKVHYSNLTKEKSKNDSSGRFNYPPRSSRHKRFISVDSIEGYTPDKWSGDRAGNRPKPREHPQEEELQKFKKEFEARQSARVKECPNAIELGRTPSQWLGQENLNKEKMVHYANSIRTVEKVNPLGEEEDIRKSISHERSGIQDKGMNGEHPASWENGLLYSKKRNQYNNTKVSFLQNSYQEVDYGLAASQIVILRPGLDRTSTLEGSCLSSPSTSLERGSMEDFLEEVKDRLNFEFHGKAHIKKSTTARGGGIETPYSEKKSDPKLIAQHIAKHVRDSVTRNLGMNLFRSESTRSYRSDQQLKEANVPEYSSRDSRRFWVKKLRNVMKEEKHQCVPVVNGSKKSLSLNNQRGKTQKSRDTSNHLNKVRYLDIIQDGSDMHSRSFRHESDHQEDIHKESYPRNLTRSLSAPLSGNSFRRLLLEDRHRLTGAHIRRQHEETENAAVCENKQKREKLNLKERVTSLKNNFMLRRRLFGRKGQSSEKRDNEETYMRDSHDAMIMDFDDGPDNSTEVPPSPASLCISVHEDSWHASEYFSPPSVSDVPSPAGSLTPNVFREISSNLKELRRQLSQLGTDGSEDAMPDEQPTEAELADIKDHDEAYVRELLLVSGLYDGTWEKSFSRFGTLGKLINIQVFEEVEENCRQKINGAKYQGENLNHKILFDLVNETLPTIFGLPLHASKFMGNTTSVMAQRLRGKKLLDELWKSMRVHLLPPEDRPHFSLERLVARDLQSASWSSLGDDCNAVGKDIECQIVEDLIDEIVKEMQSIRILS